MFSELPTGIILIDPVELIFKNILHMAMSDLNEDDNIIYIYENRTEQQNLM